MVYRKTHSKIIHIIVRMLILNFAHLISHCPHANQIYRSCKWKAQRACCTQMPRQYLKLHNDPFLQHPHSSFTLILRYDDIIWATKSVVNWTTLIRFDSQESPMNVLPCTFPVEVHAQALQATWRGSVMFMKGTTRTWCNLRVPTYDPAEHR
jgi:hypothetical protein